jgi:hypothetical protein
MKKYVLVYLISCVLFIISVSISCNRKDISIISVTDNSTKDFFLSYLKEQKTKDAATSSFIDTLISKSDWNNITQTTISNTVKLYYIPLNYNSNNTGITLLFNNYTQEVYYSLITEISNKNSPSILDTTSNTFYKPIDVISGFYKHQINNFSGSIKAFSLSNNFLWEFGYENGVRMFQKLFTSSTVAPPTNDIAQIKVNNISSNSIQVNACIEWYLVTFYSNNVQV